METEKKINENWMIVQCQHCGNGYRTNKGVQFICSCGLISNADKCFKIRSDYDDLNPFDKILKSEEGK